MKIIYHNCISNGRTFKISDIFFSFARKRVSIGITVMRLISMWKMIARIHFTVRIIPAVRN